MTDALAGLVPWLILCTLLAWAVLTDISSRRIPNRLIGAALASGLLWQWFGPAGAWAFHPESPGTTGFTGYLLGSGFMLAIFLPCFLWRILGAGDVKLLWAIGALCGGSMEHWGHLPGIVLAVLLAGGVLALFRMVWLGISVRVLSGVFRGFGGSASEHGTHTPGGEITADRMPYAVAIAMGTVGYIVAVALGWVA